MTYNYPPLEELPFMKLLLYGPGNGGKSTLAYSFHTDPRTGPVLGLNMGGNPDLIELWTDAPTIVNLNKVSDVDLPFDFLASGQPSNHPFRQKNNIAPDLVFRTLVFDTFSDWQGFAIEQITGSDRQKAVSNAVAPEALQHGNAIKAITLKVARQYVLSLPMHVVLVSQQQETVDFTTGITSIRPAFYGQARDQLNAWVKLTGRMERQQDGNKTIPVIMWDEPSAKSQTKNQMAPGYLGRGMKSPTATKIVDKVMQYRAEVAARKGQVTQDVLVSIGQE